ncbi:unnamed protein product [Durusdinium trenchii]|uniref:Uncharacterized protein n=2 Tax=Durusdinium trenchii TaxID=1381693 RepID=A0ABP0RDA0_9DINO
MFLSGHTAMFVTVKHTRNLNTCDVQGLESMESDPVDACATRCLTFQLGLNQLVRFSTNPTAIIYVFPAMAMTYESLNFDTAEAVQKRNEKVTAFLERHGFAGVNSLRDTSDVHRFVRVQQLYPLDVAEELGDRPMLSFLRLSGAKKRSERTFGSFGGLLGSLLSFRRRSSTASAKATDDSSDGSSTEDMPRRSCLVKKQIGDDIMSVWV